MIEFKGRKITRGEFLELVPKTLSLVFIPKLIQQYFHNREDIKSLNKASDKNMSTFSSSGNYWMGR